MRQDQSPTDEEKAQDSIGLDLELKDLVRFGQMFELAFIPNLPRVSHARKQRSTLLLTTKRKLFEPCVCRRSPDLVCLVRLVYLVIWIVSFFVELDSEPRAVIDQAAGRHLARWICHSPSFGNIAYMLLREQARGVHHPFE